MTVSSPRKPRPKSRRAHRKIFWGGWAAVLFLSLGTAGAQTTLPAWSADADHAWWAAHPTPDQWPQAAEALKAELDAAYKQDGASVFSQPDFQNWIEQLEWVRLGLAHPDILSAAQNLPTFVALGEDPAISHLLVEKMVPDDVPANVLQNILLLAQAGMGDLHEYAALGVAYSVVFDQPFPSDWPHPQVSPGAVPIGDTDIVKRFQFYVQANRNKKTDLDLTQLRVDDLKYLVDSEVDLSELAYAQQNTIPYDHFEDAFFSIRYDESRVRPDNMVMSWPLPTYRLAEIEKNGGICVDQAYYAATVGKGRGIPTIFFTGQGAAGGHAWFGYLSRSGKWELDCGRYASQNYPKGYAVDPQTWKPVNDAALENFAKGSADPNYQPAENALAWAHLQAGTPLEKQALEDARTIMPQLPETWQEEGDALDKSNASIDDKKAFYQSWITQFDSYADMKVEGQQRLLAALKAANDPEADGVQQDIVLQNRSTGFDLGVQGSFSAIEDKFKAQDWDGAKLAFETAVRDFKDQGGGTFYDDVIEPYVMTCVQYGQIDQADDGLHFTEERMEIDPTSILGQEFAHLKDELKQLKDVMPAMDKWLGEIDDGDYAQAWDDGSKAFQAEGTSDQFVAHLDATRKPYGKSSSRVMAGPPRTGRRMTSSNGQSLQGEFLEATYTTTFEDNRAANEAVVFMKDDDGTWRPLSYQIRNK
jgi:hypothetical protein